MNKTVLKSNIKVSLTLAITWFHSALPVSLLLNAPPLPVRLAKATLRVPSVCSTKSRALSGEAWHRICEWDGLDSAPVSPQASCPWAWSNLHNQVWCPGQIHFFSRQHMTQTPSPPGLCTLLETKMTCCVCLSFCAAYGLQELGQLFNYRRPQSPHLYNGDSNTNDRDYYNRGINDHFSQGSEIIILDICRVLWCIT